MGARRYFFNALLLTAAAILMRTVSVAFNVYVTGKVGAEGMGLLALVSSAYGFALTFATSGISLAVTRMTTETVLTESGQRARKNLGNVMRASVLYCLFFGITGSVALYAGADYIGNELLGDARTVSCLRLFALTLTPTSLSSAMSGYFNACRRVHKNALTQLCEQAVKISLTSAGLVAIAPRGLEYALLAVVGGGAVAEATSFIVGAVFYFYDRKKYFPKRSGIKGANAAARAYTGTELRSDSAAASKKSIMRAALPAAVSAYIRSGLVTIEHILIPKGLQKYGASAAAALASYGTLHGMVLPVILFPYAILGSFSQLLIPELSECRARGQNERIRHIARSVCRATLLFGVGVSGIMICFSGELGYALYKSDEASYFIRIIAPVIPIMYLDTAVDSMLKGLGCQLYCMRVNIADAAVSVALVYFLIPVWGVGGYAFIIIICEILNASLSVWKLLTVTGIGADIVSWLLRPLLCSAISCAAMRFLYNSVPRLCGRGDGTTTALFIAAGAALYIAVLALTNTISVEDIKYIRKIAIK